MHGFESSQDKRVSTATSITQLQHRTTEFHFSERRLTGENPSRFPVHIKNQVVVKFSCSNYCHCFPNKLRDPGTFFRQKRFHFATSQKTDWRNYYIPQKRQLGITDAQFVYNLIAGACRAFDFDEFVKHAEQNYPRRMGSKLSWVFFFVTMQRN